MENQVDNAEYVEATMSIEEREHTIRKAEKILENQLHIVKASKAYARLVKTEDLQTVLKHLENTALHLVKDAPKRNQEAQMHDRQVLAGIASTMSLLEDLPVIGSRMAENIKDTEETLIELRSGK